MGGDLDWIFEGEKVGWGGRGTVVLVELSRMGIESLGGPFFFLGTYP